MESTLEMLQELGLYVGMGDIYLAKMLTKGTASVPPTYAAPYLACEGISCGLTPQYAEGKQAASDRMIRKTKILTGMNIKLEYPRVLPEVRCDMLGRTMDANGGELIGDGMAPDFAVGVCATRDDGTKMMRWIYDVQFAEGDTQMKTMEDGTIEYQIPTIDGVGSRLAYEHALEDGKTVRLTEYVYDTAGKESPMTAEAFFAAVQAPWAAAQAAAASETGDGGETTNE